MLVEATVVRRSLARLADPRHETGVGGGLLRASKPADVAQLVVHRRSRLHSHAGEHLDHRGDRGLGDERRDLLVERLDLREQVLEVLHEHAQGEREVGRGELERVQPREALLRDEAVRRRAEQVRVQQRADLVHRLLATLHLRVPGAQELAPPELGLAGVVAARVLVEVAEVETSRDLRGVPPVGLAAGLLQPERRRVHDGDVEPRRTAAVDEPPVASERLDGDPRREDVGREARDERGARRGVGERGAPLLDDLAALVHDAHLRDGLVEVDPDVILAHGGQPSPAFAGVADDVQPSASGLPPPIPSVLVLGPPS